MTTRNALINIANAQRDKMMVCRETLSSRTDGGRYIEIWGYTKPDAVTRSRCGGKCNSMKLKDALLDYIQSDVFDWADDDLHGIHPTPNNLVKIRHPINGSAGFILSVLIMD